jgi:hypothetical protein
MEMLKEKLKRRVAVPSLFAIIQSRGGECHRRILKLQKQEAARTLSGSRQRARSKEIKELCIEKPKDKGILLQELAQSVAPILLDRLPIGPDFERQIDEETIPLQMCLQAKLYLGLFKKALIYSVPRASGWYIGKDTNGGKDPAAKAGQRASARSTNAQIELKVAPVKKQHRIAVKVAEYRDEKGDGGYPYSQFVTDILRASFICTSPKDMLEAYKGLHSSGAFKLIRLKNKIAEDKAPFNMHLNALFFPRSCTSPMIVEIQMYFRRVYKLQHQQHLAYELRRASGVDQLVGK